MSSTVSVALVSYRTPRMTLRAAESALESGADAVIVVDNASGDDTVQMLRKVGDRRLVIRQSDANLGFGTAANSAARLAETDALIFLNSDAELNPEALTGMLAEVDLFGGRALVGPRLISRGGAIQPSAGVLPAPSDLAIRALGFHKFGRWLSGLPWAGSLIGRGRIVTEYESASRATTTVATSMVSGACFAIGRPAFQELGGFDERFFMYFEDADLCRRATSAGIPIRYAPAAVVTHVGGGSSQGDYHFSPMHARSMRQYLEKWYGISGLLLALLLLWLRVVGFTIARHPGRLPAWRAFRAAAWNEDPRP